MKTKTKKPFKVPTAEQYKKDIALFKKLLREKNRLIEDVSFYVDLNSKTEKRLRDAEKTIEILRQGSQILESQINNAVWFDPKWGSKFFFVTGFRMLWNNVKSKIYKK